VAPVIAGTASLITNATITKQPDGSYLGTVKITNQGTGTVQKVQLTGATLGAASGAPVPSMIGNLAPGSGPAIITVAFPASAGPSGSAVLAKYSGTYTGGTFGASMRWILP
jgi:hypothetical protein